MGEDLGLDQSHFPRKDQWFKLKRNITCAHPEDQVLPVDGWTFVKVT